MCVCIRMNTWTNMSLYMPGGQRTTFRSWFSSSPCGPGTELCYAACVVTLIPVWLLLFKTGSCHVTHAGFYTTTSYFSLWSAGLHVSLCLATFTPFKIDSTNFGSAGLRLILFLLLTVGTPSVCLASCHASWDVQAWHKLSGSSLKFWVKTAP